MSISLVLQVSVSLFNRLTVRLYGQIIITVPGGSKQVISWFERDKCYRSVSWGKLNRGGMLPIGKTKTGRIASARFADGNNGASCS